LSLSVREPVADDGVNVDPERALVSVALFLGDVFDVVDCGVDV